MVEDTNMGSTKEDFAVEHIKPEYASETIRSSSHIKSGLELLNEIQEEKVCLQLVLAFSLLFSRRC